MSEEDKYYTPEIEEFHVEFEYEYKSTKYYGWFDDSNGKWKKTEFSGGSIEDEGTEVDSIEDKDNNVRVKLLDREDIESLGYVYRRIIEDIYEEYTPIEYNTLPSTGNIILRNTKSSEVVCFKKLIRAFRGTIKNKSELKKVLKMIGV